MQKRDRADREIYKLAKQIPNAQNLTRVRSKYIFSKKKKRLMSGNEIDSSVDLHLFHTQLKVRF